MHALVQKEREAYGKNLILLDNGDILQGQPTAYYYNYIDTVAPHLAAEMMNFMGYNAGNMGNHDVETGRTVFDRWAGDCRFPILGANIVDTATGETHFKPYEVLERDGVKIVVLGIDNSCHSRMAFRESVERVAFRRYGGDCPQMDEDYP